MVQLLTSDVLTLGSVIKAFMCLCIHHRGWYDTHKSDLSKQTVIATFIRGKHDDFVQHLLVQVPLVVIDVTCICLGIQCHWLVILERYLIYVTAEESSRD